MSQKWKSKIGTTIQSNNPKLDTFFKKIQNDQVDHDSTEKDPAA
jgi:hypothetical protein